MSRLQRKVGEQALERLLVLTLALEAALQEDDFSDAQALFSERAKILDEIEKTGTNCTKEVATLQQINARIQLSMIERSRNLSSEIEKGFRGRKALRAYHPRNFDSGSKVSI